VNKYGPPHGCLPILTADDIKMDQADSGCSEEYSPPASFGQALPSVDIPYQEPTPHAKRNRQHTVLPKVQICEPTFGRWRFDLSFVEDLGTTMAIKPPQLTVSSSLDCFTEWDDTFVDAIFESNWTPNMELGSSDPLTRSRSVYPFAQKD
jgi:hypothetical protein